MWKKIKESSKKASRLLLQIHQKMYNFYYSSSSWHMPPQVSIGSNPHQRVLACKKLDITSVNYWNMQKNVYKILI